MKKLISRRAALATAGAMIATQAVARRNPPAPFFDRHAIPIGIQLYTVKDELARDLDGTLGRLSAIGYRTVETAGFAGKTPADFRSALDRAGLRCTSAHLPPRNILPGLNLENDPARIAEVAQKVGFDLVVMALFYVPPRMALALRPGEDGAALIARLAHEMTADDWKRHADFLNERGRALKAVGLRLAYHNHNVEFAPMPGGSGRVIDMMIEQTDPAVVSFEMDVAWVVAGGGDPIAMLRRHAGRFVALHVKDLSAGPKTNFALQQIPADVGSGIINWGKVLPAAWDACVRRFYVEQEPPFARPPLEAVRAGFDFLHRLRS